MTAYCLSSTSRSRPTMFTIGMVDERMPEQSSTALAGGDERLPQQPVPPNLSVDFPDDDPIDDPEPGDPAMPVGRTNKIRLPEEEHGIR